jgi:GcrA cell cycle regulator
MAATRLREVTQRDVERARKLRSYGMSNEDIAKSMGRSPTTIGDYLGTSPNANGAFWTPERITELKTLWLDGKSAREISAEFGGAVSRNAVIGKLNRLGLSDKSRGDAVRAHVSRKTARRQQRARRAARPIAAVWQPNKSKAEDVPYREPPPDVPVEKRVKHNDLEAHHCRWPCGDPKEADFGFCGSQKAPGVSFCKHHLELATETVEMRRSRVRRNALEEA